MLMMHGGATFFGLPLHTAHCAPPGSTLRTCIQGAFGVVKLPQATIVQSIVADTRPWPGAATAMLTDLMSAWPGLLSPHGSVTVLPTARRSSAHAVDPPKIASAKIEESPDDFT